jgi:GTPase
MSEAPRFGFCAILGAPNAGKSTLTNALVGQKVSIVTHKVQTTRFPVRGVLIEGGAQIVLVDTPGVFAPKRRLERAMVQAAWDGAKDVDARVHVVDAPAEAAVADKAATAADHHSVEDRVRVTQGLAARGGGAILALNKVDAIERPRLLDLAKALDESGAYSAIFMVSAKTGSGLKDLAKALAARMPEGVWMYPEDQVADLPSRMLAAEITREKVFLRLHEELPYQSTVETERWEERKDGSVRIDQILYVARDGHKGIALGKGGVTLKAIGQAARAEMIETFERPVHLFLHVKVRENWADDRARFRELGLDFDV